ncbi:MAG: FAD-dependent oxidoreductase [Betaproteobacteria bacterium]|nr:FAD-dependent oxidoreductase [Betaproteobacteria bacterium]
MKVLILGAGVIGVTSAWYLQRAGHEVSVVERQCAAGLETSFANGGQISVSHAEPWANPAAPLKVLRWLFRHDAPLLFRLRLDPAQWRWGLQFLRECWPSRARHNTGQLVKLGLYSRDQLNRLRRETGIENDQLELGILHFFTDRASYQHAMRTAELMRSHGSDLVLKTPAECLAIEPALAPIADTLVGATFTPSDQSGDAHVFTQRLAELARAQGVRFVFDTSVESIEHAGGAIEAVRVRRGSAPDRIVADAYVVALGSYSPLLLRPLGLRIPVYPAKGYSVTVPIVEPERAPRVSLIDESLKIVASRLGERLRIAGTAEFSGYDTAIDRRRCEAILRRAAELFPGAFDAADAQFWAGLRPATPGNLPLIGGTRLRKLFLNTGHGTLGWTLACGSGRALLDLIEGREPEVAFDFLRAMERSARPAAPASCGRSS